MQTRSLGRTDVRLSEVALGTWGLAEQSYGRVRPEGFDATIEAALDAGITTFDLAPVWGDGEGERRVGRALRQAAVEAQVITRGGARRIDGALSCSFDRDALVADCEGSLRRLGRDEIDVWLLHNPGGEVLREEGWREAIEHLEQEGMIRAWGVSVGDAEEARLAIAAGAHALCLPHNLLRCGDLEDLTSDLTTSGCGVLARSPLMYGMLAGQWSEERFFAEDDHRAHRWNHVAFTERLRQVDQLRFLVGADHPDLATAALRYVLTHSHVTAALVGARSARQVRAAAEAASGPPYVSDEDMVRLTKLQDAAGL